MFRKTLSLLLFAAGLAIVLVTLGGISAPQSAQAQSVPQPTPRPPLPPGEDDKSPIGSGSGMGHIAGTVIDLTTGAPAAGVTVKVGDYLLTTDVNGNYDRWLPSSTYGVMLVLGKDKGVAAQSEIMLSLPSEQRVIQHLAFYGPKAADLVQAPAPAAKAVPTALPAPSKANTAAEKVASSVTHTAPARLPRTGDENPNLLLWLSVGIALMAGGVFMGMQNSWMRMAVPAVPGRALRRSVAGSAHADFALLNTLLTRELPSARKSSDQDLLQSLLDTNIT